jgi:L-rhamnose mutarotase
MHLKPGGLAEYKRRHDEVWPDLVAEIERQGIGQITILEHDPVLVMYSECTDEGAWDRLWRTAIHQEWGKVMAELMDYGPDGIVDAVPFSEIFHLETGALKAAP